LKRPPGGQFRRLAKRGEALGIERADGLADSLSGARIAWAAASTAAAPSLLC
jgi:hypothetical protein